MNLTQRPLASAFAGTLASTVIPAIAGVISSVILARTLDPFARGEMATVLLWPMAIVILGDPGLGFALSYRIAREPDSASGLWTIGLLMAGIVGLVLSLGGGFLLGATLTLSPAARLALQLALAGVPLSLVTGNATYLLLGAGHLRESNVLRGSALVLYAAGVLVLAAVGRGSIPAFAAAWVLSQLVSVFLAAVLVRGKLRAGWRWQPRLLRPLFSYGIRVYASALAAQTSLRFDQLLMSALGLSAQLGHYVVAVAVASGVQPFFSALAIVALQRVTRGPTSSEGKREARGVLRIGLLMGLPLVLLATAAVGPLLPAVFGNAYVESTLPARILLIAAFFQGLNAILGNALRGLGLPGRPAIAEGLGSVLTIALLVWLLPRYGGTGAAVVSLVVYGLVAALQLQFLRSAPGRTFVNGSPQSG